VRRPRTRFVSGTSKSRRKGHARSGPQAQKRSRAGDKQTAFPGPVFGREIKSIALIAADAGTLINFRGHLLETLVANGHAVHYVGPTLDRGARVWLSRRGIKIHEVAFARNEISPLMDAATCYRLWRALRTLAPDAVITYMIKSTVYGLFAAALARVPYRFALVAGLGHVFTEQPYDWHWRLVNRTARFLYAASLRFAHGVAFQNKDDQTDFRKWRMLARSTPSTVVDGSGVDTKRFASAPLPETPACLLIARLLKAKGLGEYIEAARLVKAKRPDAKFVILGAAESNYGAFPLEQVRAAEAEGLVTYRGAVADVRPYIRAARIFVLPSFYREGTPRSALEAMAMGRPIITTDVPGCRETVVPGRNGLLIPARDGPRLAWAILSLLKNPKVAAAMGRESRKIAEMRYEVSVVTGQLLGFFWKTAQSDGA
jgi:glycosyltransferase involved in cell wall biosynthesis